jgi:hypothetical protein
MGLVGDSVAGGVGVMEVRADTRISQRHRLPSTVVRVLPEELFLDVVRREGYKLLIPEEICTLGIVQDGVRQVHPSEQPTFDGIAGFGGF